MTAAAGRRRSHPILALIVLALVPAIVLAALWRWASARADAEPVGNFVAPAAPALTTPLLSFRRAPAVLAGELSRPAFEAAIAQFAGTLDATSCLAVSLDGVRVGGTEPGRVVLPASSVKLLVAAVVLDVLGPEATFTTEVRAGPIEGGTIAGDLYLVGGGDPLLTSSTFPVAEDPYPVTDPTSLDALADAVVAAGVQRVAGAVVGDGSRYDDEWFAPSWDNDVRGVEAGPYDALLVNDARVTGDPSRVSDPALGAVRELTALLVARGVEIAGEPGVGGAAPGAATIASVTSAPMTSVVAELLGTSDDNTAELLVKELGVVAGAGGTREAGLEVMRTTLAGWGLTDVTLADGSGLSDDSRVTCEVLLGVLARAPDAVRAGLPVAGQSGTLSDVFVDGPVTGRMRAKTGTLGNAPVGADPPAVKALAGYLPVEGESEGGSVIEFALVLNSQGALTDESVYLPIWTTLADTLTTYPQGPTPSALAPR